MVLPDLESSGGRTKDPAKEEQVRQAAAKAIKEIRSYGFEVRHLSRNDCGTVNILFCFVLFC